MKLWKWHIGPFCHDTFVNDEEVKNHIDNCHHLTDSPYSFCPKMFKEKAQVIEPMEVHRYKQIGTSNESSLKKALKQTLCSLPTSDTLDITSNSMLQASCSISSTSAADTRK